MTPALLLLGALVGGCSCRGRAGPEVAAEAIEPEPPSLAGRVSSGVFLDDRWGFSLPVPKDWRAEPGLDEGLLRVTLVHDESGARVEIWAFEGPADTLRPRGDCAWDFIDTASYRTLGLSGQVTTGTCTPVDPAGDRVYGWLLPGSAVSFQAEIHLPPDALVDGRRRGEQVVRGLSRDE